TNSITTSGSLRQVNCQETGVLETLIRHIFACTHRKTSFPMTCTISSPARRRATYVTCLECGAELAYDWEQMRVGAPINKSQLRETRWTEWRIERDEAG